jgi:hypothetical protein
MVCIIIFAATSYLTYLRTGVYWLPTLSNLNLPVMPSFDSLLPSPSTSQGSEADFKESKNPTYKWLSNGRWHYGDTPPQGVKAELISNGIKEQPASR